MDPRSVCKDRDSASRLLSAAVRLARATHAFFRRGEARWRLGSTRAAAFVGAAILEVAANPAPCVGAQAPNPIPRRLGSSLEVLSGFDRIHQVRELPDGQLLVTSRRSDTPLLVDLRAGTSRAVARAGDGPGEFRQPSALLALKDDSTLVVDLRRWVILHGSRPVVTVQAWLAGAYPPAISGIDEYGRVLEIKPATYGAQAGTRVTPTVRNATSLLVLLHHRAPTNSGNAVSGVIDTLARVAGAFRGIRRHTRSRVNGPAVTYELAQELAGDDQALLFQDGWVAIVYASPYRVEWYAPDGRRAAEALLPFEKVAVDAFQKRAFIARSWPQDPTLFSPNDFPPWPDVLPPFLPGALLPAPDGRLVILRTPDGRRPGTMYDLIDRRGILTARLLLEENERLAGFGSNAVYVVSRGEDDVESIKRHPWPPNSLE